RSTLAAIKEAAKIVQRLLAIALLPQNRIHFKPDQIALRIVVGGAAPVGPFRRSGKKRLDTNGGILQRTPRPSGAMIEHGGGVSQVLTELVWRTQAGARGKKIAEIICQPLVDPKQVAVHWLLVIRRGQPRGTPVLAVPGMNKLMRQKIGFQIVR